MDDLISQLEPAGMRPLAKKFRLAASLEQHHKSSKPA
jgi:hypothetical protein